MVGEDVSELLEMITARLKVIEIARVKKSCRRCERMVQSPAPSRPIPGSMAGPGLLAHVLVSKFDDHLPLYRQAEIFARMGADIPDTTLVGRSRPGHEGAAAGCRKDRSRDHGQRSASQADDTPIRVLDRSRKAGGLGKGVKQGRIRAYVRDQRPAASSREAAGQWEFSGAAPPGVVYRFSPDRKGEHPRRQLENSSGILQGEEDQQTGRGTVCPTNAYSGFKELYARRADDSCQFREAACWAHLRRDFHDIWKGTKSAIAGEALDRIGALYDMEREIAGQSAELRRAARQEKSKPKVDAFREWAEQQLTRIPGKGELAKAFAMA